MNIDKIEKITKVIMYPTEAMVVKHSIILTKEDKENKTHASSFTYPAANGRSSIWIHSTDTISIEEIRKDLSQEQKINNALYNGPNRCVIGYMEAPLVIQALDSALKWLIGEVNSQIYLTDDKGIPNKIGKQVKAIIPLKFNCVMVFSPIIIYDASDIAYQGVQISMEKGVLGNLTAQEFFSFAIALKHILCNLYLNSNILSLLGMMYFMNETGNKIHG